MAEQKPNLTDAELNVVGAIVAERWDMATRRIEAFEGESAPSWGNSKVMTRLLEAIDELGYLMASGQHDPFQVETEVGEVTHHLLGEVETSVRDMASRLERDRIVAARQAAA